MAKILLIEDDQLLQKLYAKKFSKEGIKLESATTGKEGLDKASKNGYYLVLLDIMLPGGINGFDVLEKMKKDEEMKNIPVIVITNLDSEKEVAQQIGVKDYIIKANITPDELVKKVKKMLQK